MLATSVFICSTISFKNLVPTSCSGGIYTSHSGSIISPNPDIDDLGDPIEERGEIIDAYNIYVDDIREVVVVVHPHYFLLYQAAAPSGHCWITVHLYSGILFLRLLLKKSKYKPGKLKSWKL